MTFTFLRAAPSVFAILAVVSAACGGAVDAGGGGSTGEGGQGGAPHEDLLPKDKPIDGLTDAEMAVFNDGDFLFDLALFEGDGLGPLYTRSSCNACHDGALRGPGAVQKMSVVLEDGVTPSPDQSKLPYGPTVHPLVVAGATQPIVPPEGDPSIRVTLRVGPPIMGRGYMEAVADSEIERVEAEQAARADAIHGRINRVVYASEANPDTRFHTHQKGDVVIGRFGVKARIATLDDFTADAAQGDMGITSPLRPDEFANPEGLEDDDKPGVDITAESINTRAGYIRMLDIPRPSAPDGRGREVFEQALCSACHVPSLRTRADYPIAALADIDAPVFTDFLLHDMGDTLSDSLEGADGDAEPREWRTSPLIGMSLAKTFLHDGRAKSLEEAIILHGGPGSEAAESAQRFQDLDDDDRAALLAFVQAL